MAECYYHKVKILQGLMVSNINDLKQNILRDRLTSSLLNLSTNCSIELWVIMLISKRCHSSWIWMTVSCYIFLYRCLIVTSLCARFLARIILFFKSWKFDNSSGRHIDFPIVSLLTSVNLKRFSLIYLKY